MIGQLTYACFAAGEESAGGWGIGEKTGLNPEDVNLLEESAAAVFPEDGSMPRFPTAEQLAARARRLRFKMLDDGRRFLWHSAAAGVDASGRPGNVFTHAVLLRQGDLPAKWIPIHAWRSPSWSVPYGADEVKSAQLMDSFPEPGPLSDPQKIVDFLTADPGRAHIWGILLDALRQQQVGWGGRIVVICDSADEAAGWVAAVTSVVIKAAARTLSFAIWEQAADLDRTRNITRIVCVDRASIRGELKTTPALLVIDPTKGASQEFLDGRVGVWMGAGADELPLSEFSKVALDVMGAGPDKLLFCLKKVAMADDTGAARQWLEDFLKAGLELPALDLSHKDFRAFLTRANPELQLQVDPATRPQRTASAAVPVATPVPMPVAALREEYGSLFRQGPPLRVEADVADEMWEALESGRFEDLRDLALKSPPDQVRAGQLRSSINWWCEEFRRLLEASSPPAIEASRALRFGDACFSLVTVHGERLLAGSAYGLVMDRILTVLLSPAGGQLASALAACQPTFIETWIVGAMNEQLLTGMPQSPIAPELAAAFAGFLEPGRIWEVAATLGAGTTFEQLVAWSCAQHGGPLYSWLRASPLARALGSASDLSRAVVPLTMVEMDWLLSQASDPADVDELWHWAAFLRGLSWSLGPEASEWASKALIENPRLEARRELFALLNVYRNVRAGWWRSPDWRQSAQQVLEMARHEDGDVPAVLLGEVAMAVALVALSTDLRLPGNLRWSGPDAKKASDGARKVVRLGTPLVMLGAREAGTRMVRLAASERASVSEPWSARCNFLKRHTSDSERTDAEPTDGLAQFLSLPLPSASWRGEAEPRSLLDLTSTPAADAADLFLHRSQ